MKWAFYWEGENTIGGRKRKRRREGESFSNGVVRETKRE
jgi:hypothetical protein